MELYVLFIVGEIVLLTLQMCYICEWIEIVKKSSLFS